MQNLTSSELTFNKIALVTTNSVFFWTALLVIWGIPFLIYLVLGLFRKGRSASGVISKRPLITYINYWIPAIAFFIQLIILIIFLLLPKWVS